MDGSLSGHGGVCGEMAALNKGGSRKKAGSRRHRGGTLTSNNNKWISRWNFLFEDCTPFKIVVVLLVLLLIGIVIFDELGGD